MSADTCPMGRAIFTIGHSNHSLDTFIDLLAWRKEGEHVSRHWLQVNNINLEGHPTWNG